MEPDPLPPPLGKTSDDKECPSEIPNTNPTQHSSKQPEAGIGLILILIALPTAVLQNSIYHAAVILLCAGTILLALSASLMLLRRHWAHFLMMFGSIGLMATCAVWLVSYHTHYPSGDSAAYALAPIFLLCCAAALAASKICLVGTLVVLFGKSDSNGTLQRRLPQRAALVGGPLVAAVLIILFVTKRPALSVHEIDADSVAITSDLIKVSGDLVIPQNIEGRRVTSIRDDAFKNCHSLTSITIPDGVTSIGEYAFYNCRSLTSITIPDSVTSIGANTFLHCTNLKSITIPDSVTSLGDRTFWGCRSLTKITIGDSVTRIGDYSFEKCTSLTSITIPDSVTSIGFGAFKDCTGLTSITFQGAVTSIGANTFQKCTNLTMITIPDSVNSIGNRAFSDCTRLTSITIPDSVTSIGSNAFRNCTSLTSIAIPDSVTSIGQKAFGGCSALTMIEVGAENVNYTEVNGALFNTEVTLLHTNPAGKTAANYVIPDGVTSIGDGAFGGWSSLTSITIPDSVTSIGDGAFASCSSLTSITIPDSVTSIGDAVFSGCAALTSITLPNSVTNIGRHAFSKCSSLTSITIPDSVTSIEGFAFMGCESLTGITIPDSVTSIERLAFMYCKSLTSITFFGDAPKTSTPFDGAKPTIYRKPEAKGWGETWGFRPVKFISEKP